MRHQSILYYAGPGVPANVIAPVNIGKVWQAPLAKEGVTPVCSPGETGNIRPGYSTSGIGRHPDRVDG